MTHLSASANSPASHGGSKSEVVIALAPGDGIGLEIMSGMQELLDPAAVRPGERSPPYGHALH